MLGWGTLSVLPTRRLEEKCVCKMTSSMNLLGWAGRRRMSFTFHTILSDLNWLHEDVHCIGRYSSFQGPLATCTVA